MKYILSAVLSLNLFSCSFLLTKPTPDKAKWDQYVPTQALVPECSTSRGPSVIDSGLAGVLLFGGAPIAGAVYLVSGFYGGASVNTCYQFNEYVNNKRLNKPSEADVKTTQN